MIVPALCILFDANQNCQIGLTACVSATGLQFGPNVIPFVNLNSSLRTPGLPYVLFHLPKVDQPRLLSFVEWDKECQEELKVLAKGIKQEESCCLFGDITAFFRPELGEIISELKKKPSMAVEVLGPIMTARNAMRRKSFCLAHGKECFLKTARHHTAGSSCTAHSRQGKQLGLEDTNVLSLLAWAGLRLEVGEPEGTLENVEQFPSGILDRLLGSQYFIEPVRMDPRMFGYLAL